MPRGINPLRIEKALKKTKRSRPIEHMIVDYEKKPKIQLMM